MHNNNITMCDVRTKENEDLFLYIRLSSVCVPGLRRPLHLIHNIVYVLLHFSTGQIESSKLAESIQYYVNVKWRTHIPA